MGENGGALCTPLGEGLGEIGARRCGSCFHVTHKA